MKGLKRQHPRSQQAYDYNECCRYRYWYTVVTQFSIQSLHALTAKIQPATGGDSALNFNENLCTLSSTVYQMLFGQDINVQTFDDTGTMVTQVARTGTP